MPDKEVYDDFFNNMEEKLDNLIQKLKNANDINNNQKLQEEIRSVQTDYQRGIVDKLGIDVDKFMNEEEGAGDPDLTSKEEKKIRQRFQAVGEKIDDIQKAAIAAKSAADENKKSEKKEEQSSNQLTLHDVKVGEHFLEQKNGIFVYQSYLFDPKKAEKVATVTGYHTDSGNNMIQHFYRTQNDNCFALRWYVDEGKEVSQSPDNDPVKWVVFPAHNFNQFIELYKQQVEPTLNELTTLSKDSDELSSA